MNFHRHNVVIGVKKTMMLGKLIEQGKHGKTRCGYKPEKRPNFRCYYLYFIFFFNKDSFIFIKFIIKSK